jgi:hypothetical protein
MAEVHVMLKACSNITSLQLRVTLLGCSNHPERYSFPFDQSGSDKYPSKLKALSLEGYRFQDWEWERVRPNLTPDQLWFDRMITWFTSGRWSTWLSWRELPDEQREKRNLDLWLDAMDFSHISNLSLLDTRFHYPTLADKLAPALVGIRDLVVEGRDARDFILAIKSQSLRHLSWLYTGNYEDSLGPVLSQQGRSLLSLEWRTPEMDAYRQPAMTASEIRELGTSAPHIHTLTIDLNRNGSWPLDELTAIANSMPSLHTLILYFEVASECRRELSGEENCRNNHNVLVRDVCDLEDQFAKPLLYETDARQMFEHLTQQKVGEKLRVVKFYIGDWTRRWDGPVYSPGWIEHRSGWFECKMGSDMSIECEGQPVSLRKNWYDDSDDDGNCYAEMTDSQFFDEL